MGYNRVIVSGNTIEIYEYENNLALFARPKRKNERRAPDKVLSADGKNILQQEFVGKRRDSARRARLDFRRLVASNLSGTERPLLFTLTYAQNETDLRKGYSDFTSFIQALRYRFGKGFKYIVVPEFQKRGAVHFHALFWGLPEALVLSERQDRFFADLWANGFIYIKETDGNERLSHYLAKYMSKAYSDPRLKNSKAYVASRNIIRPKIMKGVNPLWPVLDDYKLSPSMLLRSESTKASGNPQKRAWK